MPPFRSLDLTDGINMVMTGNFQFLESKLNVQGRLAGIAGNLKKKEAKFNEWLQLQPRLHTLISEQIMTKTIRYGQTRTIYLYGDGWMV